MARATGSRRRLSPGDQVVLTPSGDQLVANVGEEEIGQVEPRIGSRLVKLMAGGNRYEAAITIISREDVRIIIRETFAHPAHVGKVSFPGSSTSRGGDVRPYMKGSPLRYDDEEESEELEEEPEEVEELDTTLPEFSTEPDYQEKLDWALHFVKTEVRDLEGLGVDRDALVSLEDP